MKQWLAAVVILAMSAPAFAVDVGVSINIGQPDFYGPIDVGGYPQPRLIYAEPVIIERVQVVRPPIYLRVPPGQAKDWRHNCRRYDACGRPVYFVRDDWYQRDYVPRYRERHGNGHDDHDDRHDHDHDHDDRGRGHDKGKDHR